MNILYIHQYLAFYVKFPVIQRVYTFYIGLVPHMHFHNHEFILRVKVRLCNLFVSSVRLRCTMCIP